MSGELLAISDEKFFISFCETDTQIPLFSCLQHFGFYRTASLRMTNRRTLYLISFISRRCRKIHLKFQFSW